jgi:Uma2 family endonuclease
MATTTAPIETLADLLERLGGIAPSRVRYTPPPGTATEADVIAIERKENRLFELVDGVLVEKPMGFMESVVAGALVALLRSFVVPRRLGLVSAPDGMVRLFPGLVRIPDVAFVSWQRIPGGRAPRQPIPQLAPDLAVEILSEGNTALEMRRKVSEYFAAGVRQVWLVDIERRTVTVHSAPDAATTLDSHSVLDAGDVLPGFSLDLADLFAELDQTAG